MIDSSNINISVLLVNDANFEIKLYISKVLQQLPIVAPSDHQTRIILNINLTATRTEEGE